MLTITKEEYDKLIIAAENNVKNECKSQLQQLIKGKEISSLGRMRTLPSLLYSLHYFKPGKFQSEEFFNVHTANDQFKIFSNTITFPINEKEIL